MKGPFLFKDRVMKIHLTSDHAAFDQKEMLKNYLSSNHEVVDHGCNDTSSVHYPDFGKKIAHAVLADGNLGIALCGSGIGISIQVNRFKGIRGALCAIPELAKLARNHNDANILCLGGRFHSDAELKKMVDVFLSSELEGGRHQTRVTMLDQDE